MRALALQGDGKLVAGGDASDSQAGLEFLMVRLNPNGSLDPSFAHGGRFQAQVGQGTAPFSFVNGVAVQHDGKLLAAGSASDSARRNALLVVRLNPNGSADQSFGTGGTLLAQLGLGSSPSSDAQAMALQSDGKIVVAGDAHDGSNNTAFFVARLNPNGSLDQSFGSNGVVITQLSPGPAPISQGIGVVVQADGRAVVVGSARDGSNNFAWLVARLNSNGAFDQSFGSGGVVLSQLGQGSPASSVAVEPALQSDGKIVVAGRATDSAARNAFLAARLTANGSFDQSFGTAGRQHIQLGKGPPSTTAPISSAGDLALQRDGKIVVAGQASDSSGKGAFLAARLNTNGTFDQSFGAGGLQNTQLGLGGPSSQDPPVLQAPFSQAAEVAVQRDGNIVLGGTVSDGAGKPAFLMTRVLGLATSSRFRMARSRFRLANFGTAVSAAPSRGTTFRYTVSDPVVVAIKIEQLLPGRRVGSSCLAPTPARRLRPRCTRAITRATLTRTARLGANDLPFSGRLARRGRPPLALAAGNYRATLILPAPAPTRTTSFTIVAG